MSWCGGGLISVTPGVGVTQACDQFGDLEARQLPALAGLGALRDLDLDFAALVQIFRRDAEASEAICFTARVGVVAVRQRRVARGVFAALAADRCARRCGSWRC